MYKAEETGVHTAQVTNKIIGAKGKELVGRIKYNEHGTLVTTRAMVECVPPMFLVL